MYARTDLPKLYHLNADEGKPDEKAKTTRKLSPISAAKLISTNEATEANESSTHSAEASSTDPQFSSPDAKATICKSEPSELTETRPTESKPTESKPTESKPTESKPTEPKSSDSDEHQPTELSKTCLNDETRPAECKDDEIDLHADERMSDPEPDEKSVELDSKDDSKDDSKEDSRDDSFEKDSNHDTAPSRRPVQLNSSGLLEVINELKSNKSRVTKISVEKCFQRRNTNLSKNEITEFINRCIGSDVLEKVKYRDYYGIRMKASFKNGKRSPTDDQEIAGEPTDEADKLSVNDKCSVNDKSSSIADLDNLSECSSNVNESSVTESAALNEELDEEPAGDCSGYNTKKSSLKRCTPTIRYLLRTAPEEGISAADILRSLQNKRILILYDLKKFVWLMKTYFVDKNIAEQLSNGNYRQSNDEENSNASQPQVAKNQTETELLKTKEDDEIDLLADEKFSDNENFESSTGGEKQQNAQAAKNRQRDELIKRLNRMSNYLSVDMVNRIIDEIDQAHKSFSLALMLQQCGTAGLSECELASFLVKVIDNRLLKKKDPIYEKMIMYSIKKSQLLNQLAIDEITYQKVITALKMLLKDGALTPEHMLNGLKEKFKLLSAHNLVSFNDLIRSRLLKEGFLRELPNNHFKLLPEIIDETSNTSVQSASNPDAEYMDYEMLSSDSLKRKLKATDKLLMSGKTLDSLTRRPISQRKKIKKSLGPDFLDPSGVKYQLLKSSYEDKCEICLKNSDKTMVDCRKCKFKAHRICLSEIDLMFRKSTKKFECESCRVKCRVCKQESETLMSSLMTCKRCNISYHSKCLLNMTDKLLKGCPTCEKTYLKHLNQDDKTNSGSSKDSSEKNISSNNLEIDEASSSDINVRPNLLEEVPTLTQLKEIEMTDNDLNQAQADERAADESKPAECSVPANADEDPLNDGSNEDSNQSNAGSSASSSSNAENASAPKRAEEETLLEKYRKLFKAYDVHQQVKITKEQFNTLKSLNSYSNGKNPGDWSVDDVADFITSIGFPDESLIFRKEEIDGKSLLLLRRNDVLTGLSMRLGTALKVYSYIYKLQASTN